jgi:transcriptional regulator with XRE-family HTH domain
MKELPDHWRELGEFIREQRGVARLSLRRLSDLAGVSNPYLSQIERGLRRPSAEILQQIAKALRISAETLYIRAGILDARELEGDLADAITAEPSLNEEQKQTLLRIYLSFRRENDARPDADPFLDAGGEPAAGEAEDPAAGGAGPGAAGAAHLDAHG